MVHSAIVRTAQGKPIFVMSCWRMMGKSIPPREAAAPAMERAYDRRELKCWPTQVKEGVKLNERGYV